MPRLGKLEHVEDPKTLMLGPYLAPPKVPDIFDFDKRKSPFPLSSFGNDQWGNCVIVGRANHSMRLERIERRRTPGITVTDVVEEYKRESARQFNDNGPQSPGDPFDRGLYVLEALKDWRNSGWEIPRTMRSRKRLLTQTIAAYGEIQPRNKEQLRAALYGLNGVQMGLDLPLTAMHQWRSGTEWDVVPSVAPETKPGSWGGHLVYCKAYDTSGVYCLTWGREVYMTNAFVDFYCDEAWAVVDSFERADRVADVQKIIQYLRDIGATGIG